MPSENSFIKIAIVGGGPAGVSICLQLIDALDILQSKLKIEIIIFEKKSNMGFGLPYGLTEDIFGINLSREYMALMPGEHQHFSKWLTDSLACSVEFPPRHYFGKYAHERLYAAQKALKPTPTPTEPSLSIITQTEHEVLDIQQITEKKYQIHAHHKQEEISYIANFVILATGHLPSTLFSHLHHLPNYQANPWNMSAYQTINPNHHVVIIGTHLTAIDVALKLNSQNHRGQITMVSRSGLLSAVRGQHRSNHIQHLTQHKIQKLLKHSCSSTWLHQLICLFEQEMVPYLPAEERLWNMINKIKKMSPLQRLNMEIQQAHQQNHWQGILSYFYQIIFKIWPKFHLDEQTLFWSNKLNLMFTFLCSFPLHQARIIQSMMHDKRLFIQSGLTDIEPHESYFNLQLEHKKSLKIDYLIQATGSGDRPEKIPLLANMLTRHLIKKHPLSGISVVNHTHQVITQNGENNQHLYALGDLVKGTCFRTIELGQIVEQGRLITQDIIRQLGSVNSS